jgi:hypothetical protein
MPSLVQERNDRIQQSILESILILLEMAKPSAKIDKDVKILKIKQTKFEEDLPA